MKASQYAALLGDADRAGVYHEPHGDSDALQQAAESRGYAVFRVDLTGAADKAQLLGALALAMEFPTWFGHNWDALLDCLSDFSWRPADGYLILLEHCDGIHGRAEGDFVTLMRILSQAADLWREEGIAFWCFVDMQADGIAWLPLI